MDLCINCGIDTSLCFTIGRRILDDEKILAVIRQWRAPQSVTSSDHVCQACWDLAQRLPLGEPRHLGHRSVCVRCGRSLASRVSHLLHTNSPRESRIYNVIQEWIMPKAIDVTSCICHKCWVAADRAAVRMVSHPSNSSQANQIKEIHPPVQVLAADPPVKQIRPPAKVIVADPALEEVQRNRPEPTILLPDSMRAIETKSRCFIEECQRTVRQLTNQQSSEVQTEELQPSTEINDLTTVPAKEKVKIVPRLFPSSSESVSEHSEPNEDCVATTSTEKYPDSRPNGESLQADDGDEITEFCPKCNEEISHTVRRIREDQTKIVVAKVYHYFEQEYEELKKSFSGLELTPLSKFHQRTALATGVSETAVADILQEEARRQQQEDARNESQPRKRPRQTDSSSEDDSDNYDDNDDDDDGPSSAVPEEDMLVVKEEPIEDPQESCIEEPEIYVEMPEVKAGPDASGANDALADPISIDFKTEPQDEEATTSKETVVTQRVVNSIQGKNTKRSAVAPVSASVPRNAPTAPSVNAPPTTAKRPAILRASRVKAPPVTRPKAPPVSRTTGGQSAPPSIDAPPPQRRQLRLLDDGDIKMEQIDTEEGFS